MLQNEEVRGGAQGEGIQEMETQAVGTKEGGNPKEMTLRRPRVRPKEGSRGLIAQSGGVRREAQGGGTGGSAGGVIDSMMHMRGVSTVKRYP